MVDARTRCVRSKHACFSSCASVAIYDSGAFERESVRLCWMPGAIVRSEEHSPALFFPLKGNNPDHEHLQSTLPAGTSASESNKCLEASRGSSHNQSQMRTLQCPYLTHLHLKFTIGKRRTGTNEQTSRTARTTTTTNTVTTVCLSRPPLACGE